MLSVCLVDGEIIIEATLITEDGPRHVKIDTLSPHPKQLDLVVV